MGESPVFPVTSSGLSFAQIIISPDMCLPASLIYPLGGFWACVPKHSGKMPPTSNPKFPRKTVLKHTPFPADPGLEARQ